MKKVLGRVFQIFGGAALSAMLLQLLYNDCTFGVPMVCIPAAICALICSVALIGIGESLAEAL